MEINLVILVVALVLAASLHPWRLLRGGARLTPVLATLTLVPWLWALPSLHRMALQLQGSGASLVLLMLGWPLAVPVLAGVGLIAWLISPLDLVGALDVTVWLGIVPATFALLLGALVRRVLGPHLFLYVLGRGFLGTAVCVFAARALAQWLDHTQPGVDSALSLIAHLLLSWGDAFMTGMFTAMMVAYKPEWLATWSDQLYLNKKNGW
jgi:uncharacterized membrane protein